MACAPILGVAIAGASHISTSLEVSESSIATTSSDLCWFCWVAMSSYGTSRESTELLSELSPEDAPLPQSDCVDSGCTAFLDVSLRVDCAGLSEKEVLGVSGSLDRSSGDATVDRFVAGCSDTGVLAFLFPRSLLVCEGLCKSSFVFCSAVLEVPF